MSIAARLAIRDTYSESIDSSERTASREGAEMIARVERPGKGREE
jgi:hypothetical protein